jgi:hypothetical protein
MRSTSASGSRSSRRSGWRAAAAGVALCAALGLAAAAGAEVFLSQKEALAQAFPDADRIEPETFVLDAEQKKAIEELSRAPLDSSLVRVFVAHRGEAFLGWGMVDVHEVRTHPEAFLVVLRPDGSVRSVRLLAFHEPPEYMPSARWYAQFDGKKLDAPLRVGGDVHGIVGATLSAQATARGVRRALAIHRVLLRKEP